MRWTTAVAVLLLLGATGGCQKWTTIDTRPVDGDDAVREDKLLLVLTSGDRIELRAPITVEADSLRGRGRVLETRRRRPGTRTMAISLGDIEEIRAERADPVAGGVAIVAIAGGAAFLALIVALATLY